VALAARQGAPAWHAPRARCCKRSASDTRLAAAAAAAAAARVVAVPHAPLCPCACACACLQGLAELVPFDPSAPQPKMSYKDGYQKRYFVLDSFEVRHVRLCVCVCVCARARARAVARGRACERAGVPQRARVLPAVLSPWRRHLALTPPRLTCGALCVCCAALRCCAVCRVACSSCATMQPPSRRPPHDAAARQRVRAVRSSGAHAVQHACCVSTRPPGAGAVAPTQLWLKQCQQLPACHTRAAAPGAHVVAPLCARASTGAAAVAAVCRASSFHAAARVCVFPHAVKRTCTLAQHSAGRCECVPRLACTAAHMQCIDQGGRGREGGTGAVHS
jgi:hypothetical protein